MTTFSDAAAPYRYVIKTHRYTQITDLLYKSINPFAAINIISERKLYSVQDYNLIFYFLSFKIMTWVNTIWKETFAGESGIWRHEHNSTEIATMKADV